MRVALPLLMALLLLVTSGCRNDAEVEAEPATRRILESHALEWIERDSVTRPARVVTSPVLLELEGVGRGRFVAHLALRSVGPGRSARLSLRAQDSLGTCELAPAQGSEPGWQRCEIAIARGLRVARLEIELEGPDAELLVAAPRFEAAAHRDALSPVFLVVLDTARADAYRAFAEESPVGTHLDALARDGIVFTRARSPSAWTRTAMATLLTGQSPFAHRVLDRLDVLTPQSATLQESLQRAGYATRAWSSNPNVLARWGFAHGFDAFEDVGTRSWALVKPDGDRVLDRVEAALDAEGVAGGFFYVHLMDPHQPYKPDAESLATLDRLTEARYPLPRETPGPRTSAMRASYRKYLAEVLESDEQVGRLVATLRERGHYERALIAVVSDHGEEFLDHGGSGHGKTVYEEMLRVPLLLKLPESERAGTRIDADVGLADLAPTVLSALGLPPLPPTVGRDLLAEHLEPAPRLARLKLEGADQAAVVHEGWKLVIDLATGRETLFDLHRDPGEESDRSAEQPERAAALRALFASRRFEHERGWHVRACSGALGGPLAFRLRLPPAATLETRMLEPEDRVEEHGDGRHDVAFDLTRRPHPTERVLARVRPTLPDEDELVIVSGEAGHENAGAIELSAADDGPLRFAVGAALELELAESLLPAALGASARVPAGTSVRCVEDDAPHLRVWYVLAPTTDPGEIDPALTERLRALGYGE